MAETRDEAHKAFDRTVKRFEAKYPRAMECLAKDREELLAFYDYPAEHWVHIRTTNPIESTFAHGPPAEQAEPELRLQSDDPGDGLQAASERPEALEADQGVQQAGAGREQRPVQGRRALDRSVRQDCRLTGHTQDLSAPGKAWTSGKPRRWKGCRETQWVKVPPGQGLATSRQRVLRGVG